MASWNEFALHAPDLAADDIHIALAGWSWRDLERDPRCVLHALPGARDSAPPRT